MSRRRSNIEKCYHFLRGKLASGEAFSHAELAEASGWAEKTVRAYLSKKLSELVYARTDGQLAVSPVMHGVSLEDFSPLFDQSRMLFAKYTLSQYETVIVYEFFLPLTHEHQLKQALDELFYADTLRQRLAEVGPQRIGDEVLERLPDESDDELVERAAARAGEIFGGYSISLVSGRFRAADLLSHVQAAELAEAGAPYLIDETTAIVRFIAYCPSSAVQQVSASGQRPLPVAEDPTGEADVIRWFFLNVFADALTRQVKQEDEIWLLESGARSGLYIWRLDRR